MPEVVEFIDTIESMASDDTQLKIWRVLIAVWVLLLGNVIYFALEYARQTRSAQPKEWNVPRSYYSSDAAWNEAKRQAQSH